MFLSVKGLKKSYGEGDSRVDVLNGIDIEVNKGEFLCLHAPSGCGKSTLLKVTGIPCLFRAVKSKDVRWHRRWRQIAA